MSISVRYARIPWWLPVTLETTTLADSVTYDLTVHRRRFRYMLNVGVRLTTSPARAPRVRPWASWRVEQ